jgi:cytochrome c biogenesis protein ResB
MTMVFSRLSSLRFTLVGMVLLAIGAALSYNNPASTPVWVLVVPMALLAVNLLAAIITNPRIHRHGSLLVFHLALLGVVVLAAVGFMTRFEAHVEMLEGTAFSKDDVLDKHEGPLHSGHLDNVAFIQGPYTVDYAPGMMRGPTRSHIQVPDGHGGWEWRVVGDDKPLVVDGYRFYTSFNKGFAPILTWIPDHGQPETGSVNMPAYPLFEFKQDNSWTPPGGTEIKFWLRLDAGMKEDKSWVLDGDKTQGVLVVNTNGQRVELKPGDTAQVPGGKLRYERLSTWMGYKIFYDPTLHLMFATAIVGVLGLFSHFWRKFGNWSAVTDAPRAGPVLPAAPQDGLVNPLHAAPQGERREIEEPFPRGNMA